MLRTYPNGLTKFWMYNPRLTKGGGVATPLTVFPGRSKTLKRYVGNLFYILCGHFDEKIVVPRYPKSRGEGVGEMGCNLFHFFFDILSRHFEKYLHTMKLKLTEHIWIAIFLLCKQKPVEIMTFKTFTAKFWNFWIFAYFSRNIAIFRFRHA